MLYLLLFYLLVWQLLLALVSLQRRAGYNQDADKYDPRSSRRLRNVDW
jgi:hypothetical protein